MHLFIRILLLVLWLVPLEGLAQRALVVDSLSGQPIGGASVFGKNNDLLGTSSARGLMPAVDAEEYPLTLRCLGYREKLVESDIFDTIRMTEQIVELPEVVVDGKLERLLHLLAYVREYSSITTLSDTVFLFREKMVDYMLPVSSLGKYLGWRSPRVLSSRSYYRFTNSEGLDSVSDENSQHFSWSDWMEIPGSIALPERLEALAEGIDTIKGRYSPAEIWGKSHDHIRVAVNALADTSAMRWAPGLARFSKGRDVEFENLRLRFSYDNTDSPVLSPLDLEGYSFNIRSDGRARKMYRFNRASESVCATTYGEVYICDREVMPVGKARDWESRKYDRAEAEIVAPPSAPELQPDILRLMTRVDGIDREQVRLAQKPDVRLGSFNYDNDNFKLGKRLLNMIKGFVGISSHRARKNLNQRWQDFREGR